MAQETRLFWEPVDLGARERLRALVAALKGADPLAPVTVVPPSTYAGLDLRHDLGRQGSANVRFLPLPRLAELLGGASLASRGRRPLTPLVEAAAVRAIAGEARGPLEPVRHHPSLHQTLRSTFRELRHASEDGLAALAARGGLRAEVGRLYRLFRERTETTFYDREELAVAAARAVRDGTVPALKDLGPVVFFLPCYLTPGEQALVEALGSGWSCAVILGATPDLAVDTPVKELAERLAPALGPPREGPKPALPPVDRLVVVPNPQQEVRWVLRHLLRTAEGGTPFHRMAVLYRQSTPYAALVQEELSMSGVPLAGPARLPVAETPAGRTLLGLVRLAGGDLPRNAVMAWLTGCPVMAPGASRVPIHPSRWDAVSRRAGVVGGLGQWEQRLEPYAEDMERLAEEGFDREEVSEAGAGRMREEAAAARDLQRFVMGLEDRLRPPPDGSPWSKFSRWAGGLLSTYLDREAAESAPDEAEGVALERIERTLEEMGGLDEVEPRPSLDGFRLALEDALSGSRGHLGQTGRGVFLGPLATALGMRFDLVCVVGMVEGAVPPRQADDPLLPDRERQRAGGRDAGIALRGAREAEERYRYLAAMAAAERCVLSFPRADPGAQRGQFPSRWFVEAAAQLHGAPVYASTLWSLASEPWLTVVASEEDGLRTVEAEAAADVHDRDALHLWRWRRSGRPVREHHLAASGHLAGALALEQGRGAREVTPWDGDVSAVRDRSWRLRLGERPLLSATSLEEWATCPFRYLLGHVLGLAALEEPGELATISPVERGSLVHGILEQFIQAAQRDGTVPSPGQPWGEEHRRRLHAIAHQAFAAAEARGVTGKALLWELERDVILSDLDAFLREDAGLRDRLGMTPGLVEVRFGARGRTGDRPGLPAAEREIPGVGTLRFRGTVDRVDLDSSGRKALVLDYKTGGSRRYRGLDRDPVDAGRCLQLPVYALAVRRGLEEEEAAVRAAYWFVSERGGFAMLPREPVELEDVSERFESVVATISQGISAGLFPANPGLQERDGFAHCLGCDFSSLCPSRRDVLWERKQADPRLEAYLAMQGGEEGEGE